ncbi:MAG: D-alanyl-D-alanine carboxypeptidase [Spirochaetales bacterium]|nr:D-alanyl-D-alanine carboxypeptidase [Spirochaetales bacterium]
MKKNYFLAFLFIQIAYINSNTIYLWSESAISIDFETEQILYSKNIDKSIPPASMAKLINLFMVYDSLEKGSFSKNDFVPITSNADYKNLPRDSSLMFIEAGQKVTLYELMLGLAIPSGNDAAIAIAEYIFGSVDNYILEVNSKLQALGFSTIKVVDASGYNDENSITVRDFSEFVLYFLKKYPESLNELFTVTDFTYPKPINGKSSIGGIKQTNHNSLLGVFPGVDGLKTGFINKSGMNIALTAKKENRRVLVVLAGAKDMSKQTAEFKRFYDAVTLLNFSFDNFTNIYLDKIKLPKIKVNFGNLDYIEPVIPYKRTFTLNRNHKIISKTTGLIAPLELGTELGNIYIEQCNQTYIFPIILNSEINLFK